jgi:hypothetical protein
MSAITLTRRRGLGTSGAFLGLLAATGTRSLHADALRPEAGAHRTAPGPDVVVDWNVAALTVAAPEGRKRVRTLAMVHVAMHDAVNSITGEHEVYTSPAPAAPGASVEAAAARAAYAVLVRRFPDARATLDAQLATSLAAVPDGAPKADGVAAGEVVGAAVFGLRATDGFDVPAPYTYRTGPGAFRPVPPSFATPPVDTQWAALAPFVLHSPSQFRSEGPPALDSAAWAREYDEVQRLGAERSADRTAEQTDIAQFWIEDSVVTWNRIARSAAAATGNTLAQNARLFGLLNLAMMDAHVASWDTKFAHDFWRPATAIRAGETDGNPATVADPSWTPLRPTPNHPEYTSAHAAFAGAAAEVLGLVSGADAVPFGFESTSLPGVTRSYRSFSQAAAECGDARVFIGFHFRSAVRHGLNQGKQVGHYVVNHALRPVKA